MLYPLMRSILGTVKHPIGSRTQTKLWLCWTRVFLYPPNWAWIPWWSGSKRSWNNWKLTADCWQQ